MEITIEMNSNKIRLQENNKDLWITIFKNRTKSSRYRHNKIRNTITLSHESFAVSKISHVNKSKIE